MHAGGAGAGQWVATSPSEVTQVGLSAGSTSKGKGAAGPPGPQQEAPRLPDAVTFKTGDFAILHIRGKLAKYDGLQVHVGNLDPNKAQSAYCT